MRQRGCNHEVQWLEPSRLALLLNRGGARRCSWNALHNVCGQISTLSAAGVGRAAEDVTPYKPTELYVASALALSQSRPQTVVRCLVNARAAVSRGEAPRTVPMYNFLRSTERLYKCGCEMPLHLFARQASSCTARSSDTVLTSMMYPRHPRTAVASQKLTH